ncbi:Magnesium transporter [Desulfosarcina cetonica]|uniref:magnesium transporter n=1 Tax=Desulfosarcina cetonica TaxID=90730 RepID=UPI0006D04F1D|nr:magnesium transporter [Desulfosarcina cetonica]VTR63898.1 Magnesium transporter [Desulfosarcina cetonica]
MQHDRQTILTLTVKRLLRRGATSRLRKIVNKTHGADLSILFRDLPHPDQRLLFDMIEDVEQKGILFSELDEDLFIDLIEDMDPEQVVAVLEAMPNDDVADLLSHLPEETVNSLLKRMNKAGSDEVEDLMRFADDSAGGIMNPDFIALDQEITASEAIERIQKEFADVEMPFYLYVIDAYGKLVGVCSLRQLVVVKPQTPLKAFMTTDVISVQTHMDQEEVAKLVARYDILAVPVVDDNNRIVGIVTVDDVIDIFREEATEDILKMAGVGEEFVETKSIIKSTRIRLPWLFASCLGGIFAFYVIGRFEDSLSRITYLAAFIPVIMGMGGNIGTQSSTIVVRGLATGRLDIRDIWSVVGKELAVGFILGMVYGALIGSVAQVQYNTILLALAVCLAVVCSMSVAALVGSTVPMLLARINIDPAVATGPFVTTAIDIISVYFYFTIATGFLDV